MTVSVFPTLPLLTLSEDERSLVTRLNNVRSTVLPELNVRDAYYNGNQLIRDLGISIPPQLRGLTVAVGWPRVAVDALCQRLMVQGFRYAGQTAGDDTLNGFWQSNNLDEESQLAYVDAFVYRSAFTCVGTNDDGSPFITIESLRHMSALWDPRWRAISAALRIYGGDEFGRHQQATLYLPDQTVSLFQDDSSGWQIDERDIHNLGEVQVARLVNRSRVHDRDGQSEITPEVMKLTDSACRTLLGAEIAREFFAAPQRWIMGADESSFVGPDGSAKSPWETYTGRMLALSGSDDGTADPKVGQFAAGDPSAFTRLLDMYRQEFCALSSLTPSMLGETTQNPASADAIRSAENGLIQKVKQRMVAFSGGWEDTMRMALRIANGGVLPIGADRIETIWENPATPTPAATADALTKYTNAGILPAISDVVRERAGFSVAERARLLEDDKNNVTEEFVDAVAAAMETRGIRSVKALSADAAQPAAPVATP